MKQCLLDVTQQMDHKLTGATVVLSVQVQASQNSTLAGGGAHRAPPQLTNYWELMAARGGRIW